jgi:hypothetical protein
MASKKKKLGERRAAEQPEAYFHPPPFETNQYWREDIALGPLPPGQRPRKTTTESRARAGSAESHSSVAGAEAKRAGSSVARYRRANEEVLWTDGERQGEVRSSRWDYRVWTAPSVNELHPPVVSVIPSREDERMWMKLPPPSTDFLNGKKGTTTVERTGSKKRIKQMDVAKRESKHSAQISEKDFEANVALASSAHLRIPSPALVDRPDSAVSTSHSRSKVRKARQHRATSSLTSGTTSSSDADDEDNASDSESSGEKAISRPVSAHLRPDMAASSTLSSSRPQSKRSSSHRRPPASNRTSQDATSAAAIPSRTSTPNTAPLRERSNSENVSPRASPRSPASATGSPLSSENESMSEARRRHGFLTASSPSNSRTRSRTNTPVMAPSALGPTKFSAKQRPAIARALKTADGPPTAEDATAALTRHDSVGRSDDEEVVSWPDLDEQLAREQIWLGAREKVDGVTKRWSTDF